MIDSWLKALNAGKLIGCAMVGFRKAFDLVDQQIQLKKLQSYKYDDASFSWFRSYLFNRTQRAAINNNLSDSLAVNCVVSPRIHFRPSIILTFHQ